MKVTTDTVKVYGMSCHSCEATIERSIKKLKGVTQVKANRITESVEVDYDSRRCNTELIKQAIRSEGYTTEQKVDKYKIIGLCIIGIAVIFMSKLSIGENITDSLSEDVAYPVLLLVGLLSSLHCVGMCGGLMLSQSTKIQIEGTQKSKKELVKPTLLYNVGRIISYTAVGALVGAVGSVFSLSFTAKAGLTIFSGLFMMLMGLNILGIKWLRKFSIKLPWVKHTSKAKSNEPFIVGLLNGLMPCGPLQTMQIYALGTGSIFYGALSMFIFSLGTVPLMMVLGLTSSLISKNNTKQLVKFSGALVAVLGVLMMSRGMSLAGINPTSSISFDALFAKPSYAVSLSSNKLPDVKTRIDAMSSNYVLDEHGHKVPVYTDPDTGGAYAIGHEGERIELSSNPSTSGTASQSASNGKAVLKDDYQEINISAAGGRYSPQVTYVQKGVQTKLVVDGTGATSCNAELVVPSLNKNLKLQAGENTLDLGTLTKDINYTCWMGMVGGKIKVVDDLSTVTS